MKRSHAVYLEETKNGYFYHTPNGTGHVEAVRHASILDTTTMVLQAALIAAAMLALVWMLMPAAHGETYYCTAEGGLNLRWEPDRRANVEALLEYGDSVEVLTIDGNWAQVQFGDTLYCCVDYLSLTPPSEQPGSGVIRADGWLCEKPQAASERAG